MKTVRFHPEVLDEIAEHKSWYEQRSEVAAQGFLLELEHAVNAVAEAPERWPIAKRGERRYVFPRYPFCHSLSRTRRSRLHHGSRTSKPQAGLLAPSQVAAVQLNAAAGAARRWPAASAARASELGCDSRFGT